MKILVRQILAPLNYSAEKLRSICADRIGVTESSIIDITVLRRSIDARPFRKQPIHIINACISLTSDSLNKVIRDKDILLNPSAEECREFPALALKSKWAEKRPVVVGAGPAGLFAALVLAKAGASPLVLERGDSATKRSAKVAGFWNKGELDPESNVLYGEGGAGLFSDGKLTSRSKDKRRHFLIMQALHEAGAPESVLYEAEPHLGSDLLLQIVPAMRKAICEAGGEFIFGARLSDISVESGKINALSYTAGTDTITIESSYCILATGHSARDIYQLLARKKVGLQSKPFAIGVRIEIPQESIDKSQWGKFCGSAGLEAASFRLTRKPENTARSCYSFCMCPGGEVICCASSEGLITTNGMSLSTRSEQFGNAAFLVPVTDSDFPANVEFPQLAGIDFQQQLEKETFIAGGSDYSIPACSLQDFLNNKTSVHLPKARSAKRATPYQLKDLLPDFVSNTLGEAVPKMLAQMRSVKKEQVLLYGSETRSSSPVRILRNDEMESVTTTGLYPVGEGAGYAGGIVSSAIDGVKAAEAILAKSGVY